MENLLSIFSLGRRLKKNKASAKRLIKLDDPTLFQSDSEQGATSRTISSHGFGQSTAPNGSTRSTTSKPPADFRECISTPILQNQWQVLHPEPSSPPAWELSNSNGSPSNVPSTSALIVTNPDRLSVDAGSPEQHAITPLTPASCSALKPIPIPTSNSPFSTARQRLPSTATQPAVDHMPDEEGRLPGASASYAATFGVPSSTNLLAYTQRLEPLPQHPPVAYSETSSIAYQSTQGAVEVEYTYNQNGLSSSFYSEHPPSLSTAPDASPRSALRPYTRPPPPPASYSFVGSIPVDFLQKASPQSSIASNPLPLTLEVFPHAPNDVSLSDVSHLLYPEASLVQDAPPARSPKADAWDLSPVEPAQPRSRTLSRPLPATPALSSSSRPLPTIPTPSSTPLSQPPAGVDTPLSSLSQLPNSCGASDASLAAHATAKIRPLPSVPSPPRYGLRAATEPCPPSIHVDPPAISLTPPRRLPVIPRRNPTEPTLGASAGRRALPPLPRTASPTALQG